MSRTPPPPFLDRPHPPTCPLCLDALICDEFTALCSSCDAQWQLAEPGPRGPGQWVEPDAPQCRAVVMPFLDNPNVVAALSLTWRCGLADGHDEWHRTLDLPGLEWDGGHAHTYMPGLPTLDCATGEPCECDADIPAEL